MFLAKLSCSSHLTHIHISEKACNVIFKVPRKFEPRQEINTYTNCTGNEIVQLKSSEAYEFAGLGSDSSNGSIHHRSQNQCYFVSEDDDPIFCTQ